MRIGLIGTGTVGGGVIQILESKISLYREKLGIDLELACICARTEEELTPFKSKGYKTSVDAMAMIADPSIDVLVELAGGYDMPRKWITAALEHKKHVVTANKAMLAKYGHELFPLAEKNGCHILLKLPSVGAFPLSAAFKKVLSATKSSI